jgi:phage gpG-like protein
VTGSSIQIALHEGALGGAFRRMQKLGADTRPMMQAIGAALVQTTLDRFRTMKGPEGTAWRDVIEDYRNLHPGRPILGGEGGKLASSINYQATPHSVRVGSNRVYAAAQQFGAVIRPVNAPALAFFLGRIKLGKRGGRSVEKYLVFAKKVTLPARPYLGFGPKDRIAVMEVVQRELADALNAQKAFQSGERLGTRRLLS